MTELLAVITPLLLVDALNPVLFAVLIYAAARTRPIAKVDAQQSAAYSSTQVAVWKNLMPGRQLRLAPTPAWAPCPWKSRGHCAEHWEKS